MTEIQGKAILVRVSVRFELARVRVIKSRLYGIIIISGYLQHCRYGYPLHRWENSAPFQDSQLSQPSKMQHQPNDDWNDYKKTVIQVAAGSFEKSKYQQAALSNHNGKTLVRIHAKRWPWLLDRGGCLKEVQFTIFFCIILELLTCQTPKGKKCEILNLELEKVVRDG